MFWILLIGVAVGILFKPRLFTFLGLFFFEILFFSRGSASGALIAAIVLGAIACLRMELTEGRSAILYKVPGYDCKDPPMEGVIIHAAIIGVIYAASFYVLWVWSVAAQPGTRFLRLLIIYPAIALGVPLLSETMAPWTMRRRIIDTHNKEVEEERQRLEAERQAVQKRLDLACENMNTLWTKALSTYGECERGAVGHFQRNLRDFRASPIYKQWGTKSPEVPGYFVFWQGVDPAPTQVWVTNENRLQAIEGILQGADMLQYGQDCICRPMGGSPPPVRITGPDDDSRPWLQFIEWALTDFCQDMDNEYFNTLSEITKYYNGEYMAIKAGIDGEEYIRRTLYMHEGEFFALSDLRLEFPGADGSNDSVETDVLVLAPNGIFAIEVKNYGSTGKYKIIVSADGQWYKELPGGKRETIPNPVAQNDRHIAYLGRFINDLLGRDMMNRAAIENVIAIANDSVEINVYPGAPLTVTRAGNLYGCIMANRSQKFTLDELQMLKRELEKWALPPKAYPLYDYSERIKWVNQKRKVLRHGARILNQAREEHPDWFAAI